MLRKFVSIKNVGRFRNSAATGNPELARYTLIVGANGFGKTTLCAVLRSLQSGDPAHIVGRTTLGIESAPTVELLLPAGLARFDGTAWSALYPALAIFDGVFVAENVHSGEVVEINHRRNLYRVIIGEEGRLGDRRRCRPRSQPRRYSRHSMHSRDSSPFAAATDGAADTGCRRKTFKSELIWRTVFMSRSQAETAIAGYIDGFYNPIRRHSTLDFTSPVKFEAEAMQTL